ncbi:MAG: redoxin domain-containing protein [Gammaproteobacteria bacterium]|nr:redoxin domain-containing protein [Gammaproteobacteria bacterium]
MNETRIRAPELPDSLEWFNAEGPLKIADQRGKVVLLDFWTYCCINCMHVLPDLRYLEDKYPDGLTVIGVHSPKFANEKVSANVQKAINRYHIRHPVAHDPSFTLWRQYGIRAWPSIIFIDPEGYVLGVLTGEGRRKQLDALIQEHLDAAERAGRRRYSRMPVRPAPEPVSTLSFPGKILAMEDRLFISDSGRNRVIETRQDGRILRIYGSGNPGLLDGHGEESAFCDPQGMVRVDEYLFVADTGNHAIRRIHPRSGEVITVAGTGQQGRHTGEYYEDPLQAPLNSPWDLAYDDGVLYIAMAGQHQIWSMPLGINTLGVFAGSGREDIVDGVARSAAFAQPSGLSICAGNLYVADSEISAIRAIRLASEQVYTLVGMGLFEFGDSDGVGRMARLQHPLGVACDEVRGVVWIADTYNNKIKLLNIKSQAVSTVNLGCPLNEPGGISLRGDVLWIANTNAHEIVRLDLARKACEVVSVHE